MSKFDWQGWTRRLSTLAATLATISGSVLGYYAQLDSVQKAEWPWWLPLLLTVATPALAALVPVATSYKQKTLVKD